MHGAPPDADHPFGYGGLRFLWAFLAAIASFVIGGCLSVGLAINDLVHGSSVDDYLIAWIVLAVAALADGSALVQTLRQARREAALWGASTIGFLRHTSDPTLRALAVEDAAALVGLSLAAAGLLVHELGGPASSDAIASLLIGILLGVTAVGLARPLADLLIGQSMRPERIELARRTLDESPAVDEVRQLYAVHVAPQEVVLAAKVHPSPDLSADELAREMDRLDTRLRTELPDMEGEGSEPTQELNGREALTPVFEDLNRYDTTAHFNGQSTVTLNGDRASGESYCLAHHLYTEDGERKLMVASLRYLDTFVKTDGTWLFAERKLYVDWTETRSSHP